MLPTPSMVFPCLSLALIPFPSASTTQIRRPEHQYYLTRGSFQGEHLPLVPNPIALEDQQCSHLVPVSLH